MISTIEARHIMNRTNKDEAVNTINRRTALAAGLASASLISSTSAFAEDAPAGSPEARLRQLGIELPKVAAPVANYVPAARLGTLSSSRVRGHSIPMALGRRARLGAT